MVDTPIGTGLPTYTLVTGDVGSTIYCRVTATNAVGSASANSNTVGPVAAPPSAGSTWNPADKEATTILSNGNLTAETSHVDYSKVRGTQSRSSGKYYFEVTVDSITDGVLAIGLADATHSFAVGLAGSADSHGVNYGTDGDGINAQTSGIYTPIGTITWAVGDKIRVAADLDARLFWVGKNTTWAGDPGAGTGGTNWGATATAAMFPYLAPKYQTVAPNVKATLNTGASAFTGSLPSGYTAWG